MHSLSFPTASLQATDCLAHQIRIQDGQKTKVQNMHVKFTCFRPNVDRQVACFEGDCADFNMEVGTQHHMDHGRLKGRFYLSQIFISTWNHSAKPLREKVSRALNIVKTDKSNSFTNPLDLWNVTINLIERQAWSQLKANVEKTYIFFICSMELHYYIYWDSWLIPPHLLCGSHPFSSLTASRPQSATVQTQQLTATSLSQKHRILTNKFFI